MSRSIISQTASKDLTEIVDYFANINVEAGESFIQEFEKKCKNIANFPNMGRSYEDVSPFLRGIPIDGHIILYKVIGDVVTIIRVVSGRRDLKSLFSDS
ncbi:MAG: type II toxin-antitoxin system RelE/ParE family toxin [Aulosira sp. ZfuVER01]|nr:type II toxin-antitoxin system RelE/ParE family toxin [Aulosira sp. ZfuVER01]MDZ7999554.1 type II toxin-antitoxin system RelE/ParE family toxin [Aulosira sp. DedVER01a]MDZ8053969.1 type II toxin-antitoxin system RelE/ParE family toxin [Aulosira sp. ZfuCHP01]